MACASDGIFGGPSSALAFGTMAEIMSLPILRRRHSFHRATAGVTTGMASRDFAIFWIEYISPMVTSIAAATM